MSTKHVLFSVLSCQLQQTVRSETCTQLQNNITNQTQAKQANRRQTNRHTQTNTHTQTNMQHAEASCAMAHAWPAACRWMSGARD